MSDMPTDDPTRLDLAELVAPIERQQDETRKFVSEQRKLGAESETLSADQRKSSRAEGQVKSGWASIKQQPSVAKIGSSLVERA
jgi:hypothetical protein